MSTQKEGVFLHDQHPLTSNGGFKHSPVWRDALIGEAAQPSSQPRTIPARIPHISSSPPVATTHYCMADEDETSCVRFIPRVSASRRDVIIPQRCRNLSYRIIGGKQDDTDPLVRTNIMASTSHGGMVADRICLALRMRSLDVRTFRRDKVDKVRVGRKCARTQHS